MPFSLRLSLKRVHLSVLMDAFGLLVIVVSAWRISVGGVPWSGSAHLWSYGSLCAAHIAWHLAAGSGRHSSYVRWMELSSAALRVLSLSPGAWLLQRCVKLCLVVAPSAECRSLGCCASVALSPPPPPHAATYPCRRRFLDGSPTPGKDLSTAGAAGPIALAGHLSLLLFASSCLAMAQLALCRPMRLS